MSANRLAPNSRRMVRRSVSRLAWRTCPWSFWIAREDKTIGLDGNAENVALYEASPGPRLFAAVTDAGHFSFTDACTLVESGYSLLMDLDEYLPLDSGNCVAVGSQLYTIADFGILADGETLRAAQWLAWVDVINAADWILVVIVLEVEVRLQLRGDLSERVMDATKIIKFLLYAVLFACAIYWGFAGDFLDFWDAALWLFAFIFIELNVFEWQHATDPELAVPA